MIQRYLKAGARHGSAFKISPKIIAAVDDSCLRGASTIKRRGSGGMAWPIPGDRIEGDSKHGFGPAIAMRCQLCFTLDLMKIESKRFKTDPNCVKLQDIARPRGILNLLQQQAQGSGFKPRVTSVGHWWTLCIRATGNLALHAPHKFETLSDFKTR